MAHDHTTMRLVRAVRHDIEVNGLRDAQEVSEIEPSGERYTERVSDLEAGDIKTGDRTTKAIKVLALELLEEQLTDRERTEEFHRQISKYVALHPPDKPHTPHRKKLAVEHAIETFGVSERTVRE